MKAPSMKRPLSGIAPFLLLAGSVLLFGREAFAAAAVPVIIQVRAYCWNDGLYTPIASPDQNIHTTSGAVENLSIPPGTIGADYIFRGWSTTYEPLDMEWTTPGEPYTSCVAATNPQVPYKITATTDPVQTYIAYFSRVEWMTLQRSLASPLAYPAVSPSRGVGVPDPPIFGDLWVWLYYDDWTGPGGFANIYQPDMLYTGPVFDAVTNPSGPIYLGLSKGVSTNEYPLTPPVVSSGWGTPGAILTANNGEKEPTISSPLAVPAVPGGGVPARATFTGITIDRAGDDYRVTARYNVLYGVGFPRTIYSDNVIPPNPVLTETEYAAWFRDLNGCNYFNVVPLPGQAVAFGYNYYGQLGLDDVKTPGRDIPRGFPGSYLSTYEHPQPHHRTAHGLAMAAFRWWYWLELFPISRPAGGKLTQPKRRAWTIGSTGRGSYPIRHRPAGQESL